MLSLATIARQVIETHKLSHLAKVVVHGKEVPQVRDFYYFFVAGNEFCVRSVKWRETGCLRDAFLCLYRNPCRIDCCKTTNFTQGTMTNVD